MIVTKKKYLKDINAHKERISDLEQKVAELKTKAAVTQSFEDAFQRGLDAFLDSGAGSTFVSSQLPEHVAYYVEDYYGGQVIMQEATKVVVLDTEGKATYHHTKKEPDHGRKYRLEQL